MLELFKLNQSISFPSVEFALDEPNGLLAFGGDLSPERLIEAYQHGIFPWYSAQEPILWWSPTPRAIIYADQFKANKSLKKSIRKHGYYARLNTCFDKVIQHCASVSRQLSSEVQADPELDGSSTWITKEMLAAYQNLHQLGYAHSVEIFNRHHELVGGLYGVVVSGIFCGESMFHLQSDASKAAFLALSQHMTANNMTIIDCQLVNPHLQRLGCVEVQRDEFTMLLRTHFQRIDCWQAKDLSLLI